MKQKYPICPSCNIAKDRTEMRASIGAMDKISRTSQYYDPKKNEAFLAFIGNSDFEWACDDCLEGQKALTADLTKQNISSMPHLAYHDTVLECKTCKEKFVFSKTEKKFWYETLGFWATSQPVYCKSCRRDNKQHKLENKTLSDLLRKGEEKLTADELATVIEIYEKWDKAERVRYFRALLRKLVGK